MNANGEMLKHRGWNSIASIVDSTSSAETQQPHFIFVAAFVVALAQTLLAHNLLLRHLDARIHRDTMLVSRRSFVRLCASLCVSVCIVSLFLAIQRR